MVNSFVYLRSVISIPRMMLHIFGRLTEAHNISLPLKVSLYCQLQHMLRRHGPSQKMTTGLSTLSRWNVFDVC